MIFRLLAAFGLAAMLAACSSVPRDEAHAQPWNGGIWNSVLGYVGPGNAMVAGAP